MWRHRRESTRLELGSEHLPIGMIAAAIAILAFVVFLIAYFNRTPYGGVVTPPREAELAFKDYLAKNEPRMIGEYTFYNCAGFWDSLFSGEQLLAAAFQLKDLRPIGVQDPTALAPSPGTGNVIFVAGRRTKDGEWKIVSKRPEGVTFPLRMDAPVDKDHPCSVEPESGS